MIFHRRPASTIPLLMIRASLGTVIALAPLLYLTAFPEPWELPKAWLLCLGTSIAFIAWIIWSFQSGRLQAQFDRFDLTLAFVVAAGGLGSLWSFQPYVSLWGMSGLQSESFLVLFFSAIFVFLLRQTTDQAAQRWYLALFAASGVLTALLVIARLGGVPIFPGSNLGSGFLPTGSSSEVFGMYVALVWLSLWLLRRAVSQAAMRRVIDGGLALLLVAALLVDQTKALLLFLGGVAVLTFATWTSREDWRRNLWLWIAGGAALVFLAIPLHSRITLPVNADLTLPGSMSASITWNTLEKVPVLGSGPGTFFYDFVRYRPASFEALSIGQLRFIRPDSGLWQLFATYGIAGSLLVIGLVLIGLRTTFFARQQDAAKRKNESADSVKGWLLLWVIISLLLGSGSMLMTIVFWFALGLAVANARVVKKGDGIRFRGQRAVLVGAVAVLALSWYGIGRVWTAPLAAASANRAITATKPLSDVREKIERAIALDPWNAGYHMKLAEQEMADLELKTANGQSVPTDSILRSIERAEVFDSQNPALLERSIQLFGQLAKYRADAAPAMLARYERLIAVEPNSARDRVEYGKAELLLSQSTTGESDVTVDKDLAQSALRHFGQALTLKPGDLDARYHQALAHEILGDRAAAKIIMRELAIEYPNESDLLYELARQERLDENTDEALRLLNRAIEIVPGSIPVRLELARTYEARDEKDKALEILKVIDQARPNTPTITEWIKRLEGGS